MSFLKLIKATGDEAVLAMLACILSTLSYSKHSHLCASLSAPENVSRSRAVSLVLRLEGTNTMTGFLGECLMIAWYIGFAIAIRRDPVCVMVKP